MNKTPRHAALLIIGNEILSGKTQDVNLVALSRRLQEHGIPLVETRVVRDEEATIICAVNELRSTYDIVFTSGGIGPTHDDITTTTIAKAFSVPVVRSQHAEQRMRAAYEAQNRKATDTRLRMADIPKSAKLIECTVTAAPGYQVENVCVLAGVPFVFADMLDVVLAKIPPSAKFISRTVIVFVGESEIAKLLSQVQDEFTQAEFGSYPKQKKSKFYTELVITSRDQNITDTATNRLIELLTTKDISWQEESATDN